MPFFKLIFVDWALTTVCVLFYVGMILNFLKHVWKSKKKTYRKDYVALHFSSVISLNFIFEIFFIKYVYNLLNNELSYVESLSRLTSFWLLRVKWFDEMIDVYVSTASSKEIPCKGESLGNHLEGLETQIKDILMIAPAK